jgi:hypothetical protein
VSESEVKRLRAALAHAAERLERLADGTYMTEWSRGGEAGENRYRCEYAREAALVARLALRLEDPS